MTATTATTSRGSRTPRTPWPTSSRPSTTPMAHPARTPASVGQTGPPALSPQDNNTTSPRRQNSIRTPSPGYFGLAIQEDTENPNNSDAGGYARKNWKSPGSSIRSRVPEGSGGGAGGGAGEQSVAPAGASATTTRTIPHESNPSLAAFRKQSESKVFQLDTGSSITSASSPRPLILKNGSYMSQKSSPMSPKHSTREEKDSSSEAEGMDVDIRSPLKRGLSSDVHEESRFGLPRRGSPANLPTLHTGATASMQLADLDSRHPRLSLPNHRVDNPSPTNDANALERSSTLPAEFMGGQPTLISTQNFVDLLETTPSEELLLLDLRVSPQYAHSRINGALNLCIPTTLLKRPSFNVQKLLETFTTDAEKQKFSQWKTMQYIVMYDANSSQLKDATSAVNTIKKFTTEGWKGVAYVVRGGYAEITKKFPKLAEKTSRGDSGKGQTHLTLNSKLGGGTQVAGGLSMPAQQSAANPFFGNIRQNMDLIGGVGQLPIKLPDVLTHKSFKLLPGWLQRAAEELDRGKSVSDHFLRIEKAEQERMQSALTTNVTYGTPGPNTKKSGYQVAGIEKGTKNRYKDILPFDHSRVKLQDSSSSSCDYINASHIKAEWSNRHYIATQAPMPATFEDFWRVVWEQDVRVIVMLSAETEGGQRKCHPYWIPDTYGPMKLKSIAEKKVSLGSNASHNITTPSNFKSPLLTPQPERSTPMRQRAVTQINPFGAQNTPKDVPDDGPFVVVRTMTLSHTDYPFQPIREIVQLHYSDWPDFGAPAHATDLLALVEMTNAFVRKYNGTSKADAMLPAGPGERPILTHCSAGCGRTGTFCTVDSVIDMLKTQRNSHKEPESIDEGDGMEVDEAGCTQNDEDDLIEKAVGDFRHQRLSMVQTLRQYVLCYETVLEWLVKEVPEKFRRESLRRSYGG